MAKIKVFTESEKKYSKRLNAWKEMGFCGEMPQRAYKEVYDYVPMEHFAETTATMKSIREAYADSKLQYI